MKRLWQATLIVMLVLVLVFGSVLATLYSPYVTQVFNRYLLPEVAGIERTEEVVYTFPAQFELAGVTLADEHHTYIERVEAHTSWYPETPQRLHVTSLLLDGLNVQHAPLLNELSLIHSPYLSIDHIAVRNLDLAIDELIARNLNVQLSRPIFDADAPLGLLKGQLQLQTDQLYWKGEALDKLYLDMDFNADGNKIYALNFEWNKASISTQAEQMAKGWRLLNTQVDKLNFDSEKLSGTAADLLPQVIENIAAIDSLSVTNSHFYLSDTRVENLQLMASNLSAPFEVWQQKQASVSMDADNMVWQGELWLSPIVIATLNPAKVELEQFSTTLHQGLITANGELTPHKMALESLNVRGLKWHIEQHSQLQLLEHMVEQYSDITIDKANINNAQIIYLASPNLWQVSGLDLEGENLTLREQDRFALWSGELTASANTLNAFGLYSAQPWLDSHNHQGLWVVDDLYIPLENGLIDAEGTMDLTTASRPWTLLVDGFGIPSEALLNKAMTPLEWNGFGDLKLDLFGLGGDLAMLGHSLSGNASLELRDLEIGAVTGMHPVEANPIVASFDRGRYQLPKTELKGRYLEGELSGQGDLLDHENSEVLFEMDLQTDEACYSISRDMVHKRSQMRVGCE